MNEQSLADFLLRHHGVNPEDASLAAGLILDEHQKSRRPLVDLVAASKAGFPSFYRKAEATPPAVPAAPETLTQRVARVGNVGGLDNDVLEAMKRMRERRA